MTALGPATAIALLVLGSVLTSQEREIRPRIRELLILDVEGNGICLVPPELGISMVLVRGEPTATMAWTCKGSDDAFVVLDFNRNGRVDTREEILGGALGPTNGLDYLSIYDGSSARSVEAGFSKPDGPVDGVIDASDGVLGKLILWTDTNHDGVSQQDELQGLAWAGFTRIDLARQELPPGLVQKDFAPLIHRIRATRTGDPPVQRDMYTVRLAVKPGA